MNLNPEFQVIIMAGGAGSRMYPLCPSVPKPLLPVGNRPMLSFPLEMLERNGFNEVTIVAQQSAALEMKSFLEVYTGKINVKWVFLPEYMGTFETLVKIKDSITRDFIVLSCDLICDDSYLGEMINFHRVRSPLVTIMLHKRAEGDGEKERFVKKVQREYGLMDYIGIGEDNRLLYMAAAADVEGRMKISKALIRKHPQLTIETNMLDAHFYIFSHKSLIFLSDTADKIMSIKGEFVPFLVRNQFNQKYKEDPKLAVQQRLAYERTTHTFDLDDGIRCYAFVKAGGYCVRANTTQYYLKVNTDVASKGFCYKPWEPENEKTRNYLDTTAEVDVKTRVGAECVVGKESQIGARCSIKKSIIGKHCKIGERVKIIHSVIMDHVTISAQCVIIGSTICNDVFMQEGCNIKDSEIGAGYHVPAKTILKNDSLSGGTEMAL